MTGLRRLSQAISEGDGISLLAPVTSADQAAAAEADGAEGVVVNGEVRGIREATTLPVLFHVAAAPEHAAAAGADAWILRARDADDDDLRRLNLEAHNLGLETVVAVRDEEELALVLEHVDPEILLLSGSGEDGEELESVLDLLPDVPAGKLAIAELPAVTAENVLSLERAGVDGVIVRLGDVADLAGGPPPEV